MFKQELRQKQLQKLSPQQIQLMKLLQVPTISLDQRIKEEIEENPALEASEIKQDNDDSTQNKETEGSEIDISDYLSDDQNNEHKYYTGGSAAEEQKTIPHEVIDSFQNHLDKQLGLVKLSDRDNEIAEQIIGSISDDGYLRRPLNAIIDDLAFQKNIIVDEEKLHELLKIIQSFEPNGIGARNLQECLLIQINNKLIDESSEPLLNAKKILTKYFNSFSKKHYTKLEQQMHLDIEDLKEAIDEILKLNPKPGFAYGAKGKTEQYILPDFSIVNNEGKLEMSLNSKNVPDLRVSDYFIEMMQSFNNSSKKNKQQKETVFFLKQKIDSAKWFIDAIKQRQDTMYKVMRAIMQFQYNFFLSGDDLTLKPMILKDIAEKINMDISTVSRVTNSKFVQTEFGTFKLKDFFSESITTSVGEEVSTREVKKTLQTIISEEDKSKPHSDQKLTDLLNAKGYNIARRTVAKYREQLSFPVARLRKVL